MRTTDAAIRLFDFSCSNSFVRFFKVHLLLNCVILVFVFVSLTWHLLVQILLP